METTSDPKLAKIFCGMFSDQKSGVYSTGISEKQTREFFGKALNKAESDPKLAKSLKELYGIEKIEDVDKLMEQARENYMESWRHEMSEMGGWEPQNQ